MAGLISASLPAVVLSAFAVSFATVLVPSPITLAASRYSVARGTRAAAVLLTAVVITDVVAFSLMAFGFQPIMHRLGGAHIVVGLAGVLLVLGGVGMVILARRDTERMVGRRARRLVEHEQSMHGPFLAGVGVAVLNPGYWLWWTTAGTAFIHAARHWGQMGLWLLLAAFLTGVVAWYVPLLWALHHGKRIFSTEVQARTLTTLGVVMAVVGVLLVVRLAVN